MNSDNEYSYNVILIVPCHPVNNDQRFASS